MDQEQDLLIDTDFGEIDDRREPIKEDQLISEVIKITRGQRDEPGKYPFLRITLKPVDDRYRGRLLTLILSQHPDMLWMTKQFLNATGLPTSRPNVSEAIGKRVHHRLVIVNRDGDDVNEVRTPLSAA